jgi:hypothetical protein
VLEQAYQLNLGDQEIIFMIASIHRDQGRKDEARLWARKLLAINPADQNATRFIEMLDSQQQ